MFFIWLGTLMAWILVLVGAFNTIAGFAVAYSLEGEQLAAAAKHYFGDQTTGEAIDKGMLYLAAGILTGLLVEIAKNSRKRNSPEEQ